MRLDIALVVLSMALAGPGRADAVPDPAGAAEATLRRTILPNGLTLITERDEGAAVTVLEILARGGKRAEAPGKEGLAYLTTRLALEIPDQAKARELTEKASRWATAVKGDFSVIHLESLTEHFEETLDVFLEILKDPLFTGSRIDRVRDDMDGRRKVESDDKVDAAHLAHMRLWLRPAGYAGSPFGEEAALKTIKSRDVEAFFKAYFAPDNLIVVAVSDMEGTRLAGLLGKAFGALRPDPRAVRTSPPARASEPRGDRPLVLERDSKQVCVSMGFGLPPLTAKTYALARVFENLLGKGPGSRLWPLRAEERLAYTVSAQATLNRDGGLLEAYLETDPAKRDAALSSLEKALADLQRDGVGPEELAETQAVVKSEFLRANETRDRRTGLLGFFEAVGLGADYFEAYPAAIDAVTVEEINAFIKGAGDPAKATVVLAGSPVR
jgi:predicted Zn-dependent peptidase